MEARLGQRGAGVGKGAPAAGMSGKGGAGEAAWLGRSLLGDWGAGGAAPEMGPGESYSRGGAEGGCLQFEDIQQEPVVRSWLGPHVRPHCTPGARTEGEVSQRQNSEEAALGRASQRPGGPQEAAEVLGAGCTQAGLQKPPETPTDAGYPGTERRMF